MKEILTLETWQEEARCFGFWHSAQVLLGRPLPERKKDRQS